MKLYKGILIVLFSGLLIITLSACEKEGGAEKAGKAIDSALTDIKDKANEAKEVIEEKMEEE